MAVRKALVLLVPLLLLVGFVVPSAQARDHHRDGYRGGQRRAAVTRQHNGRGYYGGGRGYYGRGNGYYRRGYYSGYHRHHDGYWRYRHGRRYWYEDGGYFLSPGGVSINIGL